MAIRVAAVWALKPANKVETATKIGTARPTMAPQVSRRTSRAWARVLALRLTVSSMASCPTGPRHVGRPQVGQAVVSGPAALVTSFYAADPLRVNARVPNTNARHIHVRAAQGALRRPSI